MGIVFGCITPHPPLLIPDVGKGQEKAISATKQAMEKLAGLLAGSKPECLLIVSPHGKSHSAAMGVLTAPASTGSMRQWGSQTPPVRFKNDQQVVGLIQDECRTAGVPLEPIGAADYDLDHGVMVPLHFLAPSAGKAILVPLTFSWLPLEKHFAFGKAIGKAAERSGKKVALIASGDLSHRLLPEAPAGFDAMGKVFDERLVEAVSKLDSRALLALDTELIEHAGECGLRSIVILLGALDGLEVMPQVMSYEGPFGVGYLVASFMVESRQMDPHPLVELARETVESYVRTGKRVQAVPVTPEMKERAGVFVCLKKHGELRGCIGTFEPTRANVAEEVVSNAIGSATHDPRFSPVTESELGELEYSVDVLTPPEPVAEEEIKKLDPKQHGIIVECDFRRGLLLPDLEGVDTVGDQIAICRAKAGIMPGEPVKLYRFKVRRYK